MSCADLCSAPCACAPAELKPEGKLSRRGLLGLIGAGLATVGLSTIGDAAFAASKTYTVCKTTAVKVGDAGIFKLGATSNYVIVTQPKKGVFKAFSSLCTHQGVQLSGVSGKNLVCNQHGATFDTTTGAATGGPTRRALTSYKVTISGTSVKVTA